MSLDKDIAIQIKDIFDNNTLSDLNRFLSKRQCLNTTNSYLMYLFHLVQSAGILTTSVAVGYNNQNLIWAGVALNVTASLINVYEKMNMSIMKKLMHDITAIKDGLYIDEGSFISEEQKNDDKTILIELNKDQSSIA
jgi:hypothetical protein